MPARCRSFLLSDRDERNGRCSMWWSFGLVSMWCFLLVANCRNTSTHRTIVRETRPKANLPPAQRKGKCRAPGCEPSHIGRTDNAIRGLNLQVVFGLPCGFLFLRRERVFSSSNARMHHCRQCTSCPATYWDGMYLLLRSGAFEEFCCVNGCANPFFVVELFVECPHLCRA